MKPVIHQPCSIESPAFAYDRDGTQLPRYQFATIIEDDVEIMPFAVIQGGNARATRIGRGTKIDHGTMIGHDVEIGPQCTVVAHAVICGYVVVEENAYLGAACVIRQRLRIGRDAMIGMGAVVIRDVPPNCVVVGNPARFLKYRFPGRPENALQMWNGERWA